ncbi:DDE 1 multi-domain protein [Pyrenophora teres f. teres]|uniref:DDE 1 multi-domain protein n=1 Tax=Pyrenophora teres f. teres TaxID=97479 RepID=A0A6S6VRB9_9PLEO|nr:DDE 1 multi-domain protein [Pyrenophora teres f. teres]
MQSNCARLENHFHTAQLQKEFGVDRTTLSRRHQHLQLPNVSKAQQQQALSLQQEKQLVLYIERCAMRGLPPTREMIQDFAGLIAKREVSESLVTRFLHRHADELTIKWSAGIDRNRHKADSKERCILYFHMLFSKIIEYGIEQRDTWNADEKGFAIGILNRLKRVFTKAVWASKQGRAAIQDGNREWITPIACLLILDGHGSHLTTDFIDFCDANKILLAVFPPHATHTLQPLDVGLFSPLASNYSRELAPYIHGSQALVSVKKGDFFSIFWKTWSSTMSLDSIKKSFQATGVWLMDAEVILQRFNNNTTRQDEALKIDGHGDGDSWIQLRKVFDAAVADKAKVEAKRLAALFHSLQTQNELLYYENDGLRAALNYKQKRQKKITTSSMSNNLRSITAALPSGVPRRKLAEESKMARARAKQARDAAKKAKAEKLAAAQALKQQQRNAATSPKSRDTHNKGKRAASRTPISKNPKRRRGVDAGSGGAPAPQPPPEPPKTTTRGRPIRIPQKFK